MYFFFEGIPRERRGCSKAVQAGGPQLPVLTGLVPFHMGITTGCTPTPPPSQIPIQMLACTSGRGTHHPKSHGTDGGAPLSRLERCGVSVHLSSHPHNTPVRSIPQKNVVFCHFPHQIH